MIVTARGVLSGADLSGSVERTGFSVEATFGARMDILKMQLHDPTLALAFPDRAEIVIYDAPDYQSGILAYGATGYWRLGDHTGTTAVDEAGTNNGTTSGTITKSVPGLLIGDSDTAMTFDGSTGLVTIPSSAWNPGGTNPFTIGCWINPTVVDSTYRRIGGREPTTNHGAFLFWQSSAFGCTRGDSSAVTDSAAGGSPTVGTITFVCATYDGTNIRLYLNGSQVNSMASSRSADVGSAALTIGGTPGGGTNGAATVDEFFVASTALSAAQILTLSQIGMRSRSLPVSTAPVIDPPFAVSTYNTYLNGAGNEKTSTNPLQWTPRIFAGYCATPVYSMDSTERAIQIQAQDYTYRLRSTVINQAYAAGNTDQFIVQNIFAKYRPDFDTTNVQNTVSAMPAISFPVHSLEQFMQRVVKISRAVYRVDYFKRLFYGAIGQVVAPLSLSDNPDGITTFGYEHAQYSPDVSSLSDKVWVVGSTFLSATQTYTLPAALVNGSNYQFPLPGAATKGDIVEVKVAGVSKTWGQTPGDGDITDQTTFKFDALIQSNPATVSFKITPPNATVVTVKGQFRYPLIQSYADPALVAASGGLLFEAVVRDRRVTDLILAQNIAKTYLKNQGLTLKGLTCTVMQRGLNNILLQPGQTIPVTGTRLFTGLGGPTLTFIITRTNLILDTENDLDHPYRVELEAVDHPVAGGY